MYRGTYWAIRTPVDNSKIFYYCLQGYVLGNTYPCRGFLASPKGYVLPTHIAHLGRLDGFNLPSNNVNTMSLARTYPGIPSSRLEGQYHPHLSALKWANTNLRPSAVGSYCHFRASGFRVVLPLQSLGRYSWIRPRQTHGILSVWNQVVIGLAGLLELKKLSYVEIPGI